MKVNCLAFALLLLTASACTPPPHAPHPLPNIILLMGDDHGWDEVGYNGHPFVQTPVLDAMA
ncbi:MAG: N-acetylgalactosamine-6-sulfatase, partial [Saprospiraceae bacterium]|nr:N-acetylgalactosamine-6-sulfatase [Saprospiraceae bacterium]